jgi:hypothetical protein
MGCNQSGTVVGSMSQLGHSLPNWAARVTSASPPIATIEWTWLVVRFVPIGDIRTAAKTFLRVSVIGENSKKSRHRVENGDGVSETRGASLPFGILTMRVTSTRC